MVKKAADRGGQRRRDHDQEQGRRPQQDAVPEVAGDASPTGEQEGDEPADDAAHTEHRAEHADSGLTEIEKIEGDAHLEDERCPGDDGLSGHQPGDDAELGADGDGIEARQRRAEEVRRRLRFIGFVRGGLGREHGRHREAGDERRRDEEGHRVDDVDDLHVGDGQEQAGERRPGEEADTLDGRGDDVGGRELERIGRQTREQGGLCGTERERDRRRDEGQAVHEDVRPVGGDDRGGRDDHHRACQIGADHHELLRIAVGERRQHRSAHGHHDVAGHAEQPERGRAAFLEGPHRDGDGIGPIADHRGGEGQVDPTQPGVAEHRRERAG